MTPLLAIFAAGVLSAASLQQRLDRIVQETPATARALIGVEVVDLESAHSLYAWNAAHFVVPASNTKLFTTALALTRLGANYRFETRVLAMNPPGADGYLAGDLILKGSGDPSLTGRPIPYSKDAHRGDALRAIEELADQIFARGIRRIDGDIVGDDTAYAWEPYPPGWSADDAIWDYGAPVSALTLNDNMIRVTLTPGEKAGDPARIALNPPLEYLWIDNQVRTALETAIQAYRAPGAAQISLTGTIASPVTETLAVDDPARFAACALADALTRRGVAIGGRPVARHRAADDDTPRPAEPIILASRTSPSLEELLRVTDKVSQNLYAEMALREAGHGSRHAGLEEMKAFLAGAGADPKDYSFEDGSGLSRLTLVTPHAITQLLAWMYRSPNRDVWVSLLPVGAEDGSLRHRFGGLAAAHAIHAKTGSLSHVSALSGYAIVKGRHPLAFSIVVNNYNTPASEVVQVIDKIAVALIQ
jgi:D-alanyl-D-alanine carboxypeptidase/D-alanyl-D-alanine-endopeptidase (penicillin-binding protein 4)